VKIESILKGVENVQKLGKDPNQMINCITFTKPLVNDIENTIRYFFEKKIKLFLKPNLSEAAPITSFPTMLTAPKVEATPAARAGEAADGDHSGGGVDAISKGSAAYS
jgi:hypothetical protein